MGIPSYFREIIRKYPDIHFWNADQQIDHLCFDFNGLIYNTAHAIEQGPKYEARLIKAVIAALNHVVFDVCKPRKTVLIAVDGPVPKAKMILQRQRRYKKSYENTFFPSDAWDTRNITPGTKFMKKLDAALLKYVKAHNAKNDGLTILLSGSTKPGEGEHKIMKYIKRELNSFGVNRAAVEFEGVNRAAVEFEGVNHENSVCIYGLDADLIVLSIALQRPNIVIIREPRDSEIEKKLYAECEFLYLSIDRLRQAYMVEWTTKGTDGKPKGLSGVSAASADAIFYDYMFLTFLCGNDFVKHIQFLKIKNGSLDLLLELYPRITGNLVSVAPGKYPKINRAPFAALMAELAKMERAKLIAWQNKIEHAMKSTTEPEESDPKQVFEHTYYYSPFHPLFERNAALFEQINFKGADWKEQYYTHYLSTTKDQTPQVVADYIKSLNFTLRYYLTGVPDWRWHYPWRAAPLPSDIVLAPNPNGSNHKEVNPLGFEFDANAPPYTVEEQLIHVMPPEIAPPASRKIMKKHRALFYIDPIVLDVVGGEKHIYAEPILPPLNL